MGTNITQFTQVSILCNESMNQYQLISLTSSQLHPPNYDLLCSHMQKCE